MYFCLLFINSLLFLIFFLFYDATVAIIFQLTILRLFFCIYYFTSAHKTFNLVFYMFPITLFFSLQIFLPKKFPVQYRFVHFWSLNFDCFHFLINQYFPEHSGSEFNNPYKLHSFLIFCV